ncbi:MAG: thioredoxin domain-containing protein, partial [Bdellovibrionales bacterium]|nr:thioredoxin domain-containing protein [Bdellovibrionales bacterium]
MRVRERTNLLGSEQSPYLRQHKDNPIWWFPWGDEPFEVAALEEKPVFLSVGYSTCHWCHVMERESFEDEKVAEVLNRSFVSIKLDREERPDIDRIYMSALQAIGGHGGWPMTILLTPEKKPFFAATYIPKKQLLELLANASDVWNSDREAVLSGANQILEHLVRRNTSRDISEEISLDVNTLFLERSVSQFDAQHGGFRGAPKFPPSQHLRMLIRIYHESKDPTALKIVEKTLTEMAYGGIYDHLGGGFHRYSVDAEWLVPHFEKMLYDNAQLAVVYLEAFQITKNNLFKDIADDVMRYVLREMTDKRGGFFSAQDADSEGQEGKFFVWNMQELKSVLSAHELSTLQSVYALSEAGNFDHQTNIFSIRKGAKWGDKLSQEVAEIHSRLFRLRSKRVRPLTDEKILTDWNGLMIFAMAFAFRVTRNREFLIAAQNAARFIREELWKDGILLHRYCDGDARFVAGLDDYAYLISGLLELYQADSNTSWFSWASQLQSIQDQFLYDEQSGAYHYSSEELLYRSPEYIDGALPNSNGVSVVNLLKLCSLTGKALYLE